MKEMDVSNEMTTDREERRHCAAAPNELGYGKEREDSSCDGRTLTGGGVGI
jgi:hypothetical protein